jgi:hypothetical protein
MYRVSDSQILSLPKIGDLRGNLSIIEQFKQIPFEIRRVYWIYDVPGGLNRGDHAYKESQEFIVALSGSFDVVLDDGVNKKVFQLNRSYFGLYVPQGMWRKMMNFSTNSLALVLSSTDYSYEDYIMNYEGFLEWRKNYTENKEHIVESPVQINKEYIGHSATVFDCSLYMLHKNQEKEGNLTYVYQNVHVPFKIDRVFYSYDIPGGEDRGGHAHLRCHQFIIAASGAFEVVLDDGVNKRTVTLNRPFWGLHVQPGIWASEQGFSSGSICLVLASEGYDESDYIRNYDDYLDYLKKKKNDIAKIEKSCITEDSR